MSLDDIVSELQSQYNISHAPSEMTDCNKILTTKTASPTLFFEKLPYFGRVPMLFFIPESSSDAKELQVMIEEHGGIVIYIPEGCCF